MVCGDPSTGERSGPEPLLTLASFRRERAAINFGVLLGGLSSRGGSGNDMNIASGNDGTAGAADSGSRFNGTALGGAVLAVGMTVTTADLGVGRN